MMAAAEEKKETNIDLSGSIAPAQQDVVDSEAEESTQGSNWFPSAHQLLLGTGGKPSALGALANDKNVGAAKAWLTDRRRGLRGWREFAKTDKFHLPTGPAVVGKRIARNVEHFQSNYAAVFIVLTVYCVVTSPMLLLALAACASMFYYVRSRTSNGRKVAVGGRQLGATQLYALVAVLSLPLFYVAGAGAVIFWVIGASVFLILLHAALYASEPVAGAEFITEDV